jgi:C-terminal processing protease CtpA/Prc
MLGAHRILTAQVYEPETPSALPTQSASDEPNPNRVAENATDTSLDSICDDKDAVITSLQNACTAKDAIIAELEKQLQQTRVHVEPRAQHLDQAQAELSSNVRQETVGGTWVVHLTREEGKTIGIRIRSEYGIFAITDVVDGSIAASVGNIHDGDYIHKVNDYNTYGCTHDDVVNAFLRNKELDLTLSKRPPNPPGRSS